jgi:large subunit ribosomal protein L21
MIAIIQTGGKQYQVAEGDRLRVEKLEGEVGAKLSLAEVLLVGDEKDVQVGAPFVSGAAVEATILKHGQGKKVTGIKYKPKKRSKVKFGHRQLFTEIEVTAIKA